jgi:lysophospholipase L1-like esterase
MKKMLVLIMATITIVSFAPKGKTWVAIGDSITYLNDHADETGNRVKKGYMTMVAENIPGLQFINQGHNGWTSGGIADKIEELGITGADVYSVFLGTNDWWQGRPVGAMNDYQNRTGSKTLFGSYAIIIAKLRSLNKAAKIILITPLQRVDFVYINDMKNNAWGSYKNRNGQSLEEFANAIKAIGAREKLEVVDLYHNSGITFNNLVKFKRLKDPATGKYKNYPYPDFVNIPFNPETDEYPYPPEAGDMTYDGLHPSDKGNAVIAKMLVKAINK